MLKSLKLYGKLQSSRSYKWWNGAVDSSFQALSGNILSWFLMLGFSLKHRCVTSPSGVSTTEKWWSFTKKNKEPRAAGRMGTSCSGNVRGITCKFMVLDWDQGLTFLGLEQIDLKVKLSVLSNHRQIHKSFWKLSFRFPEHLKIFFFSQTPNTFKSKPQG